MSMGPHLIASSGATGLPLWGPGPPGCVSDIRRDESWRTPHRGCDKWQVDTAEGRLSKRLTAGWATRPIGTRTPSGDRHGGDSQQGALLSRRTKEHAIG